MERLNKEQFMDKVRADHARKEKEKKKGNEDAKNFTIENTIRVQTKKIKAKGRRIWRV